MKFITAAACFAVLACCATLQAAFLPLAHLDSKALDAYTAYVEKFERDVVKPYTESGKMWLDQSSCCMGNSGFANGKTIVEPRNNDDVPGGSIHHFSGAMHINGATIEDMRHIMEDYPAYTKNFKPDVTKVNAMLQPDSTAGDDHFISHLTLSESTLWMNVEFETTYDTHYRMVTEHRWFSRSVATSIKELKDAKDPSKGTYPEGDDHGFLWRTQTYWFVRESNGGIDLELDSVSLARPNVTGFSWFGSKRSHDAVDKMLHDAKNAIAALHGK